MEDQFKALKRLVREAQDLSAARSVLSWDQQTFMPPGGGPARGRQLAVLAGLHQQKATDPEIGRLLDALQPWAESLPYDDDRAAFFRLARRVYERLTKIPLAFVTTFAEHQAATYQAWAEARPRSDFKRVQPFLEKTLDYSRQMAGFFPGYDHIADPLIDFSDYGMKASEIRAIFSALRQELVPLIQEIHERPQVDDSFLHRHFPHRGQVHFSEYVVRDFGYDFDRGRLDFAPHPFTTSFSIDDVRITTRVNENALANCLFAAFHEAGHGMHAQGCNPAYEGTPLAAEISAGLAESQSRTWENIVGRSLGFWEHYYPRLQATFPEQLHDISLEAFYQAANKVQPSLIRVAADEVTYNLHPMIRFDLELSLLEGSLSVRDLPDAWNARYTNDLGVTPPNASEGVLQDVHWFDGWIGGSFQGYTLGNILSAMLYEKALEQNPQIPAEIRQGVFSTLLGWLRENIYQHGGKYATAEVAQRITGGPLTVQPLMRYLRRKYGEIYGIAF